MRLLLSSFDGEKRKTKLGGTRETLALQKEKSLAENLIYHGFKAKLEDRKSYSS